MRIKELLKEKHYTQKELADKMNVSLSAVRQMVAAESLTTATLEKIATALNVPMWKLFASPEEVQPTSNVHSIKCPKCGNEFPVSVNVELKTENNR